MINNFITYYGATYIRLLTVYIRDCDIDMLSRPQVRDCEARQELSYIDWSLQDWGISRALVMEISQTCAKVLIIDYSEQERSAMELCIFSH